MLLKGRYEILESLGSMTRLARDRRTGAQVIVKEVVVGELESWHGLKQLEEEAEALETVNHRAVPALVEHFALDEDSPDPRFFLVREFVDGVPISSLVTNRLPRERLVGFARAILSNLGELHELSPPLVHGNLSPDTIWERRSGALVFLDFDASPRETDGISHDYSAPERYHEPATIASDLYAAGAVLFSLATGHGPERIVHRGGEPSLDGSLPSELGGLLGRVLRIDPDSRPRSSKETLDLLERGETAIVVRGEAAIEPFRPRAQRAALTLGLALLLEAVVVSFSPAVALALIPPIVGALYFSLRSRPTDSSPADEE